MRHFQLYELVDRETYETRGETAWELFDPIALEMLDDLRDFFNHPITVNNWHAGGPFQFRGYRPPTYKPGVTPGSYHRMGRAFDFDVKDHTATEARKLIIGSAKVNNPLTMKVQRMEADVNWCHVDIAPPPKGHNRIYLFHA